MIVNNNLVFHATNVQVELERLRTEKSGAMIELGNVKQEHTLIETELMAVKKELKGYR